MAARERIIGGGFLVIGVAIVLILLYFFTWGGTSGKEAYDRILGEIFPAYEAAVSEGDYLAVKNNATRLLDALDEGGSATVRSYIKADATSKREAQRLSMLLESGTFEKNRADKYGFDGGWYSSATHRGLTQLSEAVTERLKTMRGIRETATKARAGLDEVRVGSKLPLTLPPAKGIVKDDAPIVEPNPLYEHDQELFRVFGLEAKELEKALALPDPGGRSTSSRLRWNKSVAASSLGAEIGAIPERADSLNSIANQIDVGYRAAAKDPSAKAALGKLLERGARALGMDLEEPHRAAYNQSLAAFAKGNSLVNALRSEAKMLAPYLTTVRPLGKAFQKQFVQ